MSESQGLHQNEYEDGDEDATLKRSGAAAESMKSVHFADIPEEIGQPSEIDDTERAWGFSKGKAGSLQKTKYTRDDRSADPTAKDSICGHSEVSGCGCENRNPLSYTYEKPNGSTEKVILCPSVSTRPCERERE